MRSCRPHAWKRAPQNRWFLRWAWLLAAAVLLRGLIPVGYMLNPDAGPPGTSAIILCDSVHDALSAVTTPMIAGPMAHHHHHEDGTGHAGHSADAPCVFAAVAALAVGLLAVILVLSPLVPAGTWAPTLSTPWPHPRPPGTRLARGPPALFS
ncbi:DUF2946 family protein [Nitrospirillum iridis]|uniref:DUF2946 domain-containing protein n=1 Tax=Nitrospirillum iridis TaxID=765888 RepID=A0A7X0AVP0_9PROT|nr:DUF2946 family protein [Nitrospirillum iridis]MBB6250984.1 hypothetical protein [Nitrospirillum iridis]